MTEAGLGYHGSAGARERATALIDLRRYEEAVAVAREGLSTNPHSLDLTVLLAIALCQAGDLAGALAAARQAVALQPANAWAHHTLGWVLHVRGLYPAAIEQLSQVLSLDPYDAGAHILRAEAMLNQASEARLRARHRRELIARAEWHGAEAVRLEPTRAGGYIVHALVSLGRSDTASGEAWARRALAAEPDHPGAHEVLGQAAELRGDARAASDHYLDAGLLDPRSESPLQRLRNVRSYNVPPAIVVLGAALFIVVMVGVMGLGATVAGRNGMMVALGLLCGLVALQSHWMKLLARRKMSERARAALQRDRELRGWHLPGR